MAFKEIKIDPKGDAINFELEFEGVVLVTYNYNLHETKVNGKVFPDDIPGTNRNPHDDAYTLPLPVEANIGRLIKIISTVEMIDKNDKDYRVTMHVKQGSKELDVVEEKGTLGGNFADVFLTAFLNSK
jgi:hypothetical protein